MVPKLHCRFPFGIHQPPMRDRQCMLLMERELSTLSTLFYKSSIFFIAFIYYVCKIYLSNDESLFGAHRQGEQPLAGSWGDLLGMSLH